MAAITPEQVEAAYNLAKTVRSGSLLEKEAVLMLVNEHGMVPGSAYGYVRQLDNFLLARTYTRTINDFATRYFLMRIGEDFGSAHLESALLALEKHIAYYEAKSSRRPALRSILNEFRASLPVVSFLSGDALDQAVAASRNMTDAERGKLLPPPGHKPAQQLITVKAYARSQHVIAAALLRANGICDDCKKPAPFAKKSDGTPFLEVHHRQTLANGGEDTLRNVVALCPNCHRKRHHG